MTYAKRKAARPAKAIMTMEPWTLDAAPVAYWLGVAVAAGAVPLREYEMTPVPDGAAVETVGATVTVL